jgi:hypothetical protein
MLFTNLPYLNKIENFSPSPNYSTSISSNSSIECKAKPKFKKDALEPVDFAKEYQTDPKYKTELCKSFTETGFCAYGNKCRFAHGRQELFDKLVNCKKYKQKECLSFFKNKYCCYGSRCHFKHEERKLGQIDRSYYTITLAAKYASLSEEEVFNMSEQELIKCNVTSKRLQVFTGEGPNSGPSTGANSNNSSNNNVRGYNNKVLATMRYLNQIENLNDNNTNKFTLGYSNLLPLF